jgi:hypothetical protein
MAEEHRDMNRGNNPRATNRRFRSRDYWLAQKVALLLEHFANNPHFMEAYTGLVDSYRPILETLSSDMTGVWPNGMNPVGRDLKNLRHWWAEAKQPDRWLGYGYIRQGDDVRQLQEAVSAAEQLAQNWGLNAPWGPAVVLQSAAESARFPKAPIFSQWGDFSSGYDIPKREIDLSPLWNYMGTRWLGPQFLEGLYRHMGLDDLVKECQARGVKVSPWLTSIAQRTTFPKVRVFFSDSLPKTVQVDSQVIFVVDSYNPSRETREGFLNRATKELRRQADEVEAAFKSAGLETMTGKSEMERHIYWLYLAISPDPDLGRAMNSEEIAGEDASEKGLESSAVRKAVDKLARDLGIKLAGKRGRPRKM